MQQCFFNVPSMHSLESAKTVSMIIGNVNGVKNVNADYENSQVGVFYDNHIIIERISTTMQDAGYKISLI